MYLQEEFRRLTSLSEIARNALGKAAELRRRIYLELGRRLVLSGVLEAQEDIFFLSVRELIEILNKEFSGDAKKLVNERKREREGLMKVDRSVIIGAAETGDVHRIATPVLRHTELTGIPASPGTAQGHVRIIRSIEQSA